VIESADRALQHACGNAGLFLDHSFWRSPLCPRFQPKGIFCGQLSPDINPDADKNWRNRWDSENVYALIKASLGALTGWDTGPTPSAGISRQSRQTCRWVHRPHWKAHYPDTRRTQKRRNVANPPHFHKRHTAGTKLPYITQMDEIFGRAKVKCACCKLVNAEVD